jgi:hypothetical protein
MLLFKHVNGRKILLNATSTRKRYHYHHTLKNKYRTVIPNKEQVPTSSTAKGQCQVCVNIEPDCHPGLVGQIPELHLTATQHCVCSISAHELGCPVRTNAHL